VPDARASGAEERSRLPAEGGRLGLGPQDMYRGDRFAELTDPFGHRWMPTAPKA
jgi:uncharacterized glyoxalase superfamily protein PhnB